LKKLAILLSIVFAVAMTLSITIPALAATDTDTVTVTGSIQTAIEVNANPNNIDNWDLTPADGDMTESSTVTVDVNSNADWTLKAQDLTAGKTGYMKINPADTTGLQNAFTVNGSALTGDVTLTPGSRPGGSQDVTLAQDKSWSDAPGTYTITVTFVASN
jgi:hypothetical protein